MASLIFSFLTTWAKSVEEKMAKKVSVMLVTDNLVPNVVKGYWDVGKWSHRIVQTMQVRQ